MKIIIAPDSFGETLSAAQAARCIARGWQEVFPNDTMLLFPQSDGGPGFIEVLRQQGGELRKIGIVDVLGDPCTALWLRQWDPGSTISYFESALACGLAQLSESPNPATALKASSYGLGQLVFDSLEFFLENRTDSTDLSQHDNSYRLVIGLGGTASNDGGRGFVEALAAKPRGYIYGENHTESNLQASSESVDEIAARSFEVLGLAVQSLSSVSSIELLAATDVDNPLLGLEGAIGMFSAQKGADSEMQQILEERNLAWGQILSKFAAAEITRLPGAGAGGGLGAAIFALGGRRISGSEFINQMVYRSLYPAESMADVGLIITGEGKFDAQSLHGKVVDSIVEQYARHSTPQIPVIVIAGQVQLSAESYQQAGIARVYSLSEYAGSVEIAMREAKSLCTAVAQQVAKDWKAQLIVPTEN